MSLPINVGIIGVGNMAKAHVTAAKKINNINFCGSYDLEYQKAQQLDSLITPYSDAAELIDKVDAVIITTPNHAHIDYAISAIKKNKHVLCEKPMATSVVEAEQMLQAAHDSSVYCYIGFNYRFLSIFQRIKHLINNDELGEVIAVELDFKRSSALTRKFYTWRDGADTKATSGALGDLGSHLIDILYYLFSAEIDFGSCVTKIATYVKEKENIPVYVDDYAVVNGILVNGIHFKLLASKVAPIEEAGLTVKIIGTKKELWYDSRMKDKYLVKSTVSWNEQAMLADDLENPSSEMYGWLNSLALQLESWANHISTGTFTAGATFADGLRGQKALAMLLNKRGGRNYER